MVHGDISFEANVPHGTCAKLTIPAIQSTINITEFGECDIEGSNRSAFLEDVFTIRMLLVDDCDISRKVIPKLFRAKTTKSIKFDFAEDGQQGLTLLQSKTYDIVLTDNWMPVTDGVTMLKMYFANAELDHCRNVFMYSANTEHHETDGRYEFIPKPLTKDKIEHILDFSRRLEIKCT